MAIDRPKCMALNFHNFFGCRGLMIGVNNIKIVKELVYANHNLS